MLARWIAVLSVLVAAMLTGIPARAADCDCGNLGVLQVELRNALRLQAAFRGRIGELRQFGTDASQAELQRFAAMAAHANLESDGTALREVEYVPYGQDVAEGRLDSLSSDQLCAMRASSAAALDAADRAAACAGIGRALRAHEGVHVAMCRRIGYRAYLGMHGADRAAEEAEGYGTQIAVLRAEIVKVIERLNPRIEVTSDVRMQGPPNPMYSAIVTNVQAEVRMTRAVVVDTAGPVRFEGQGQQILNARVEGNCRFTGGMPVTHPIRAGIETDGLEARITYSLEGTTPAMAMQCRVPGGGSGASMSMPVPISGGLPEAIILPLRTGVEQVTDMAATPAAAMMAQARMRISGEGRFRLVLDCPAR